MVILKEGMLNSLKQFNHFKIHTQFSICEGAIKIDELAAFCKEKKFVSAGICDSLNLCGALEFAEKLVKQGTHPIIGSYLNLEYENVISKLQFLLRRKKVIKT